jgi:hypothetical protein
MNMSENGNGNSSFDVAVDLRLIASSHVKKAAVLDMIGIGNDHALGVGVAAEVLMKAGLTPLAGLLVVAYGAVGGDSVQGAKTVDGCWHKSPEAVLALSRFAARAALELGRMDNGCLAVIMESAYKIDDQIVETLKNSGAVVESGNMTVKVDQDGARVVGSDDAK